MASTITLPKRHRDGAVTDDELQDYLDTIEGLSNPREAVVVGESAAFDSENGARNRARYVATALTEYGEKQHDRTVLYSAHAVGTDDDGWTAAISVRTNQEPRPPITRTERPEGAPTVRELQERARDLKIKGRSKMDYDTLRTAVEQASAAA